MKKLILLVLVLCILVVAPAVANVTLNNAGFETGDLTGWTTIIPTDATVTVVSSYTTTYPVGTTYWEPVEGDYFALLKTDGPGSVTHMTQSFYADAGELLQFSYFWDSEDYVPFNDVAWGTLTGPAGLPVTLFQESVSNDGVDYYGSEWKVVSYMITTSGTYWVDFFVSNTGDAILDSHLGVDAYIPAPGAILLGSIGVGFVGWLRRRRAL